MKGGTVKRATYMQVVQRQAAAYFNVRHMERVKAGVLDIAALGQAVAIDAKKALDIAFKREHRRLYGGGCAYSPNGDREMARRVRQMRTGHIPRDQIHAV